jgi:uncharacterized protein (DUF1330 family)
LLIELDNPFSEQVRDRLIAAGRTQEHNPLRRRNTASHASGREDVMKMQYAVPLALIAGIGIGAVAVQTLHAQAKPPVYYIAEIEVTNLDAYTKEFVPLAQAAIKSSGGRFLAQGGKVTVFEGEPPKSRVILQVWDNLEKIQAWRASAEFKASRVVGEKYAKFRTYAVEGVAP